MMENSMWNETTLWQNGTRRRRRHAIYPLKEEKEAPLVRKLADQMSNPSLVLIVGMPHAVTNRLNIFYIVPFPLTCTYIVSSFVIDFYKYHVHVLTHND